MKKRSVVLLGDSILDNGSYTDPEPDTTTHLQRILGDDWSVSRLAQDGAVMDGIRSQLERLKGRPDVAVLSVGGNDVIRHAEVIGRPDAAAESVLTAMLGITENFGRQYEKVAQEVGVRAERTVLCTIYEVQLHPPLLARLARVPLSMLNDRIIRAGARHGVDVLDLRSVCTEPSDFVKQIEPSPQGAAKIAAAIAGVLQESESLGSGRLYHAR
jgi:lysophospholipase L1-like esterase